MIYKNKYGKWCRICPKCRKEIVTNSWKWNANNDDKLGRTCISCKTNKGKIFLLYGNEPYKLKNNMWGKKCPKCSGEMSYNKRSSALESIRSKRCCKLCTDSIMRKTPNNILFDNKRKQWYNKCICCGNTKYYSCKGNATMNINTECRSCSVINGKHNINNFGRKLTEKAKENLRIKVLSKIKMVGGLPSFNLNACKFIDKINENFGWNLQHAKNGGEVEIAGYCVDGYDKEKNIVFEYDEPSHNRPKRKQKDIKRQQIIMEKIKPSMFIRYDEKNDRLYDTLTNKDIKL